MALRFRKSIKLAPGVRLNLSKSGVSTSIGGKGVTVNLSKRGTRTTVGVPGTGMSWSQTAPARGPAAQPGTASPKGSSGARLLGAIGLVLLLMLAFCQLASLGGPKVAPSSAAAVRAVGSSAARCRAEPTTGSAIVETLYPGAAVSVTSARGEWSEVRRSAGTCWIMSRLLRAAVIAKAASAVAAPQSTPTSSARSTEDSGGAGRSWFAKSCKRGQPCGNACISWARTCHIG